VRSLASRSLPVLEEHLRMAQSVGAQVNATNVATSGGNAGNMSSSDRAAVRQDIKFIRENTSDNYLEVSLGQLAMERAQNPEVKSYAEKIVKDHNALQDSWLAVAQQAGLGFKTGMGKNHRAKLTKLQKLHGRAFDRAFMTQLIRDNKDYLDYLEKEGRATHSTQVRNLVEKTIPVLHDHFEEGKRIGAQVGANTNVTLRSEK
jgi:putative membrane protein